MQSKHLGEMCCHEIWGSFTTSRYLVPVFPFCFWPCVDSSFLWSVVNLFVTFISFCMIWKKCPDVLFLSLSNCMVANCIASAMLVLRRNKACDIHILAGNQCFLNHMTSFICQPFPAQDYVTGCGHGMTALRHNSWDFIRPVWWLQVVNINVVCLLYHSFIETQLHICKHSGSCSRCIAAKSYALKTIMSFYPHLCWKDFNLCTYLPDI